MVSKQWKVLRLDFENKKHFHEMENSDVRKGSKTNHMSTHKCCSILEKEKTQGDQIEERENSSS